MTADPVRPPAGAEELLREVREARAWLSRRTRHLAHIPEVRNLAQSASGACDVLGYHLEHPDAGVKVPETLAELRGTLAELRALVQRHPPPPPLLPAHLESGEFRPVAFAARRHVPRVLSKWNVFGRRRGR